MRVSASCIRILQVLFGPLLPGMTFGIPLYKGICQKRPIFLAPRILPAFSSCRTRWQHILSKFAAFVVPINIKIKSAIRFSTSTKLSKFFPTVIGLLINLQIQLSDRTINSIYQASKQLFRQNNSSARVIFSTPVLFFGFK
jgi:hypothetical protein